MQLILAIDSDPRRSEQLASLVRARLKVDLVQSTSAGEGLHLLKDRVPDLILTSPLLSPFDDGVLDEYLRDLGAAGAHVQTVRIPVLSAPPRKKGLTTALLSLGRTNTTSAAAPDGCDPTVFADEIALYLSRAAEARQSMPHLAQAWSARQEDAAPNPVVTKPIVNQTAMSDASEAIIEEFTGAVELPRAEPVEPRYARPAEPSYNITSEPIYVRGTDSWPVDEPTPVQRTDSWHGDEPTPVEAVQSAPVHQPLSTGTPIVNPMPEVEQTMRHEPTRKDRSSSFEAALAAIRAAWAKPEKPISILSSPADAAAPRATTPGPATPPAQREVVRQPRPENRRPEVDTNEARPKQDEWGIFDPDQCGFSAVVDKLDKVAESKDAPPRSVTSRVISIR